MLIYVGLVSFYITCVCRDRLHTHEHAVSTQRLHLGLVLLALQKSLHSVAGDEGGALQHAVLVHSERGDGRDVPHLPAQGVVIGAEWCLTQGLDAGVSWGAERGLCEALQS